MENIKISTFLQNKPLITISTDETVESALSKLYENKITGAPILDNQKEMKGFVDYIDLVHFLVQTCTKALTDVVQGESRSLKTDDMAMMRKRSKEFRISNILDVVDLSKRNAFFPLYEDQDVREAIRIFSTGIHRILVRSRQNDQVAGIVSQVDVIGALSQDKSLKKFQSSIGELLNKTTKIMTVPASNISIDSFILMHQNFLSSIAVTDERGEHLIGNLSAADLRGAVQDFTMLLHSTIDYLKWTYKSEGKNIQVIYATPKTSLHDAVMLMQKHKIHRIYVAENDLKPIAVVSFTDIAKEFVGLHA